MSTKEPRNFDLLFEPAHVRVFSALSHDRNPLHLDADYARRTQFGRVVMFGIGGFLLGFAAWAKGRRFTFQTIRAQFHRPLFIGQTYNLRVFEAGDQLDFQTFKGNQLHARVRCALGPDTPRHPSPPEHIRFKPRAEARSWDESTATPPEVTDPYVYEPNWTALPDFEQHFGLSLSQIPLHQLQALLWSSYFVGMEAPGRQALFVDASFTFDPGSLSANAFELHGLKLDYGAQYHRLGISGTGTGIRAFELNAFSRPQPVRYPMEKVRASLGESSDLRGKTVFITGACRGFGEVLSKAFALRGASLALNFRAGVAEAQQMAGELERIPADALFVRGDAGEAEDCARMQNEIFSKFKKLDFLVCNAFPPLETKSFLGQSPGEFLDYLRRSVGVTSNLLFHFLPRLEPGATVIHISTIAAVMPEKEFGHYVAAKTAVEGLFRVLAREFPGLRFLNVRPPRMLTDPTNLPYDPAGPASAVEVAGRFLRQLKDLDPAGNYVELNL